MTMVRGRFFPSGAIASLIGAALFLGSTPAAASPDCNFAQPFAAMAKAHKRVVKADPKLRTTSRTPERWAGQIILTKIRFIKWPKREPRPAVLAVDFEFVAEDSCPYYPDLLHQYFVLEKDDGRFAVVNSSKRRR